MEERKPVIEIKGIQKGFYGVPVLKGIDLSFYEGECVGLIGENGAGKSTLIKILCGIYKKDAGQIFLNGKEVDIHNAEDSKELGISVIYQELSLFPDMTVYENIFINSELCKSKGSGKLSPLDIAKMRSESKRIMTDVLKVEVDVNKRVRDLTFSQKQMVEIARAVYADSRIIFMDEPTTALEDKEKNTLFSIMKELKSRKKTIIFISHHLDELFANCERTVVLRDGYVVLEKNTADLEEDELVAAMIGKNVDNYYPKVSYEPGETILSVKNLTAEPYFKNISFDVHEREIVGIIGLAGCGKYEVVRSIFGKQRYDSGTITKRGQQITSTTITGAMKNKFAFLPSDRKVESIFPVRDVSWNTTIADIDRINTPRGLNLKDEQSIVKQFVENLNIKVTKLTQPISSLSGGNQQKVILARWLLKDPDILMLEDPTRGIDVNAKTEVYKLIMDYVGNNKGVILVSAEAEEIYGICDTIVVMHNGEVSGILNREETTLEEVKTIIRFSKKVS
ncbi:MAG: sugar ABC transporter ATP-binding protein [Lachnospiraceae bacterium]|nr:sugar ABC transporter ATP-binding protein [Lachnospiraceae bacterium]